MLPLYPLQLMRNWENYPPLPKRWFLIACVFLIQNKSLMIYLNKCILLCIETEQEYMVSTPCADIKCLNAKSPINPVNSHNVCRNSAVFVIWRHGLRWKVATQVGLSQLAFEFCFHPLQTGGGYRVLTGIWSFQNTSLPMYAVTIQYI